MMDKSYSETRMTQSIRVRLNQIGWQLDLIRVDSPGSVPEGFAQVIYSAEGMLANALDLLGGRRSAGLPPPHRYQHRTPPPEG